MKPDKKKIEDRGESLALMEPLTLANNFHDRDELSDLALELTQKSARFRGSLPQPIMKSLADLVRTMNCYYSNLIEGHDTHPIDIERAMKKEYANDKKNRDLQLEARAHVAVQGWIDEGGLKGRTTTEEGIREIHRRFCSMLPDNLLWVEDLDKKKRARVEGGEFRSRDVKVAGHIGISPGAVPRFIRRFEEVYSKLGRTDLILCSAAAHHRLLWVHPFLDGNGRVARLMSHAMLFDTLDTGALWSVARGLARKIIRYKEHLADCDATRRNDLDGRGNLSEEALVAFSRFFLRTCIDQVDFMRSLIEPDKLRTRIELWAEEETRLGRLPSRAKNVLATLLYRGELRRGEVANIVGTGDRHARRIIRALVDHGAIRSEGIRAPLCLAFPANLAARWMPGLFPEKAT